MNRIRIFISNVPKEFAEERKLLRDFLRSILSCAGAFTYADLAL